MTRSIADFLDDLTDDQTQEVARWALGFLPLDQRVQAVLATFDRADRAELMAWLEEADD